MKSIFYNEAEKNIRAGWRMGIFAAVLACFTALSRFPAKFFMLHVHFLPSIATGEIVFYGLLLLTTWLVIKFLEHRPPLSSVGFPLHGNVLRELGQGTLIGGGMMTVIFITEYSFGMVTMSLKSLSLLEVAHLSGASVVIFVIGAFGEELLFRGYLFQTMIEGTGKIIAVIVFASFFGLAHASNPNVTFFSLVNVALAGVWLSLAYFKTRTLWFPIALHFSWNFFQNHIFSFPVSGIQFQKYQLGELTQFGPAWLTGGSFGPEGGALTTVMLIVAGVFIYFSDWIKLSDNVWTIEKWNAAKAESAAQEQSIISKTEPL